MSDLESIFVREFHQNVRVKEYKDIFSIDLPDSVRTWKVSGTELYLVKGIDDPYYSKLNNTIVKKVPKGNAVKKRVINKATRSFKKDEEGNFLYEDYKTPTGCVAVVSNKQIGVPFRYASSGEDYIDFVETPDGLEYLYALKKENLYQIHQTALVLSVKNMKNYSGMGYVTWDSGVIYLHVIPYSPNSKYIGSKVLKTGYTLGYNREVQEILNYWQKRGIIPSIALSQLKDGTNLVLKPTSVGYNEYTTVEQLSLGDAEVYGAGKREENKDL